MSSPRYAKLSPHDGDDLSETLSSSAPTPKSWAAQCAKAFHIFRVVLETALLLSLLALIFSHNDPGQGYAQAPSSNLGIMPHFATKGVLFQADENFISADSFANLTALEDTRKYWTRMTVAGRGAIVVDPVDRSGLSDPYEIPIPEHERKEDGRSKEEVYMVDVFHQLHCLSTLMTSYGHAVIEGKTPEDLDHDAHCFDLLRQSLLCAADTTVEGQTGYGIGWGTIHQCKDIDAIRVWVENRAGFAWHHFPGAL
ncbi:uncharacterized protein PG986_008685 [Apiospora aurea]|uniref:Oxidase ustYa n=1 Tax=Apiospora aurea TaxID=335848 RepID=A0ABR1Q5K1_9PEZI